MRYIVAASRLVFMLSLVPPSIASAGCSVSSPGMAFGAYQPLTFPGKLVSVAITSDATISVSCTGIVTGGDYTITLGPSPAGSGDRISVRSMSNLSGGPDMLFNIYRDPAYSTVWGDGLTAGAPLTGTIRPGDSNQTHTVYGRIPGGQNTLQAGQYTTALTVTISYTP